MAATLVLAVSVLAGCSKTSTEVVGQAPDDAEVQLKSIATAYFSAVAKLNRPPRNMDELKPFLKLVGDPDQIMRSPHDGQPFEIVWNVESDEINTVFAYEKQGSGGKRWVLMRFGPTEMDDQQFAQLNIPKPGAKK
jgi:hypothetical protein